jgi:tetratricopeptide (TPR) repeat protein
MAEETGQKTGQAPPLGFSWGDYMSALVAEAGTLTAVAWRLAERGAGTEDVASIERALRRLRGRGQQDGGSWGQRLLRAFGVPRAVEDRLRFMGLYHSLFSDLPLPVCLDQLRIFDRPPVSESRARVWLHLGYASIALRRQDFEEAGRCLARAAEVANAPDDARIEQALASAYLLSRKGSGAQVTAQLDAAERALASATLAPGERACFQARLIDQRAFQRNFRGDHTAALALYRSLPEADSHPFASYRRDAGLAFGYLRAGEKETALVHARRACDHAGDGGYTRLRVMALILMARIEGQAASRVTLARAQAIAERLEDEELLSRVHRVNRNPAA